MRTVVALLALLGLAACTGADDAGTEAAGRDAVTEQAADGAAEGAGGDDEGQRPAPSAGSDDRADGEAAPDVVTTATPATGRRVIRTAELELAADEPEEAVDAVVGVAEDAEGHVATTDLTRDEDDVLRGRLTLRVPSARLLDVVERLEELAVSAPVSRIDEQDVTGETVDLRAQRTNLTAYEQELRGLLAEVREDTSSPDDLLRIFERIREVREEIDRIEARLDSLDDQVELATVHVTVEPAATALAVADPGWQPLQTAHAALTTAARGLGRVADVAIWLVVGILPVALVAAAPVGVGWWAWRRTRRPAADVAG